MSGGAHASNSLPERSDLPHDALECTEPPEGWEVAKAASGEPTVRLNGKWLHSPRDPRMESARLVDHNAVPGGVVVFYGLGLGYPVEYHLDRSPENHAVVVEPEPRLIAAAAQTRDLSALLANPRVHFIAEPNPERLAVLLRHFENRPIRTVRLRAIVERSSDFFLQCDRIQETFFARRDINGNTLKRFGGVWVRNLARNAPILSRARGVNLLADRFAGVPALVLAAGPSLDLVLPHLEQIRRSALIVAVDTAAAALTAHGWEADLLVVVDPQWWNTRHLDRVRSQRTVMVSESSTHPRVFRLIQNQPLFAESLFPLGRYLERATQVKGTLGAGGSVATSAWDLARLMGCSPIYCAGLDLGFPDQRTHCHGSFFEERMHELSRRLKPAQHHAFSYLVQANPYRVADNRGGTVLTDQRMAIYHWWFENQAQIHPQVDTRTLSPGGVAIAGVPFAALEELLSLPVRRASMDQALESLRTAAAAPLEEDTEERLRSLVVDLIAELGRVERSCMQGLDALDAHRRGSTALPQTLRRLDQADRDLRALEHRDIAGFLVQDALSRITRGEDHGDALETSRRIYESLWQSAQFHIRELKRASSFLHNAPIL